MGGFVLCNKDDDITESSETLSIERLDELDSEGKIRWPCISEKEIKDRSKGDLLSKGLVICQTTWFMVQYIARAKYKLPVTELELVALALAVMNGIVYFFWWNKPQNVACPIPVYLLSSQQEAVKHTTDSEETPDHDISSTVCDLSYTPLTGDNDEELNNKDYHVSATNRIESNPSRLPASVFTRYCVKLKDMALFPFYMFFSSLIDMFRCDSITEDNTGSSRVPTFYSPPMKKQSRHLPHIPGAVLFIIGGIHQGWFFQVIYPRTPVWEVDLWHASVIAISVMPSIFIFCSYLCTTFACIGDTFGWIEEPIIWAYCGLYILARIACLILPLLALRSLPASSLLDVNWSYFIPHISHI